MTTIISPHTPRSPLNGTRPRSALRPARIRVLASVAAALLMALFASVLGPTQHADATMTTMARATSVAIEPGETEVFGFDHHPNGAQMVMTLVEQRDQATLVTLEVVNGRDFTTYFTARVRDTRLIDDSGDEYELLDPVELELEPGGTGTLVLPFERVPDRADSLTLEFQDRGNDDESVSEGFPTFVLNDIDVTESSEAPPLPATIEADERASHPNGAELKISEIEFDTNAILVGFVAENRSERRVAFTNGRHVSFLEDDLGNRYYSKLPDGELALRIDEDRQVSGTWPFAGRIHPDASTIRLVLNDDESATNPREIDPKFELGPWTLSTATAELVDLELNDTQEHPSDVTVRVTTIEFRAEGAIVTLQVTNDRRSSSYLNGCCDSLYLEDDLGNRFEAEPVADNRSLEVEPGESIEGTLAFPADFDPSMTELSLAINDREADGLDDPRTIFPEFRFGPWPIEWTSGDDASISELLDDVDADAADDAVRFTLATEALLDGDQPALPVLVGVLEAYGEPALIEVFTDSLGSSSANERSTQRQADELLDALEEAGLDVDDIEAIGRGEDDPVASNATTAGRAENRRVVVTIETGQGLLD